MDQSIVNDVKEVKNPESKLLGVSTRGWIAIVLTLTVCLMSAFTLKVEEPLYTAFSLALGFYFGQKNKGQ